MFGIFHDHGLVVSPLQFDYCNELLEQLERDGYKMAKPTSRPGAAAR